MSKNTKFLIGLLIGLFLAGGIVILAAPVGTVLRSVIPETNNTYYLGTTSPRAYWANLYTQILTVTSGTATTTINAGDSLAIFAYPFSGVSSVLNATTSGLRIASSSVLGVLNIGTLTATSGTSYLQALTLGTKLANAELANSSITLNTTSPLGGGGSVSLGGSLTFTCSTCAIGTINSGTANRVAYYSGATTFDSANGLIINAAQGSTTIASNLTVTSIFASSTARITGALTLDTALTVANGGTGATSITGLVLGNGTSAFTAYGGATCTNQFIRVFSASGVATCASVSLTADVTGTLPVANGGTGATTFTANGVLYGNTAGAIQVTAQGPANSVLTANAGAPSFSASPTITNITITASSTLAGFFNNGNATSSGNFTVINGQLTNARASTTVAATFTPNWRLGSTQYVLINSATVLDVNATSSNPASGGKYILQICQNDTGYAVSWGSGNTMKWTGSGGATGATTTLTSTANQCQDVGMWYDDRISKYNVVASTTAYGKY